MTAKTASALHEQAALQSWFGGRIPIVIGVVGHRDFSSSDDAIMKAVRREFRQLRKKYRKSPFLVLSGLAEGADRMVARLAVDELEAKLVAILPFPAAEFARDFDTRESRREFESLLSKADAVFEVPLPSDQKWKQNGSERDTQYARVGALIAEQSQIMLAIWDRRPARGIGGTAQVVEWFERGYAPPEYSTYEGDLSLFDPPQPGYCIRIDPTTAVREYLNAPPRRRHFGLTERVSIFDILRRTENYNNDVQREAAYRVKKTSLVPAEVLIEAPVMEAYVGFAEADALAIFYARRVRLADRVLYALTLTAVFAFNLINDEPLASWSFLAATGLMVLVYLYVAGQSLNTKFLEYRSFAEAMRILFFYRMLGLHQQVWLSYLSKHGTVVRWLRHAIRAVEFAQDRRPMPARDQRGREKFLKVAIDHWLGRQIAYFKYSVAVHARGHRRGMWIAYAAGFSVIATSLMLAFMTIKYGDGWYAWREDAVFSHPFGPIPIGDLIKKLQLVVTVMIALGAVARGILMRAADLELSKQYASALDKYDRADKAIQHVPPGDPAGETPTIFAELGREALLEQAEWLWLRHSRPFEPPTS